MSKKLIFIGNLKSPLAVERFMMLRDNVDLIPFFYDRQKLELYDQNLVKVRTFKQGYLFHLRSLFFLLYLIFSYKISVLHFHGVSVQFLSLISLLKNIYIISTPQGSDINQSYVGKNKFFTKILLNNSDMITVKSLFMEKRVKEICKNKKIQLLNWGVNDIYYEDNSAIRDDNIYIVSPRTNKPNYNINSIFDAIGEIKKKYKNVKFIYVSLHKIPEEEGDISIADEIYYSQNALEMREIYKRSDIMISIPSNDGFSTSIMESIICGCLPVISNLVAYEELDDNYANVIKVNYPYTVNLINILHQSILDIQLIRENIDCRKDKYSEIYSKHHQCLILKKIYKRMV